MLWQKREDFLPPIAVSYGTPYRFEITREFPIEAIFLSLRWNIVNLAGTSPTWTPNLEAPWNFFKRIVLTVADGARTRNVVDISGIGLAEWVRHISGSLGVGDTFFLKNQAATTKDLAYHFMLPIFFGLPNLADPVSSLLLLPAPRYNSNLVLQVTMADNQATCFTLGGTSPVLTDSMTLAVHVIRREVKDPNWQYFDTELAEARFTLAASATNQMYELQVPGSYTGLLLRGYVGSYRGDPSVGGTFGDDGSSYGEYSLKILGNVIRRWTWAEKAAENELSLGESDLVLSPSGAGNSSFRLGYAQTNFQDFLSDKPGAQADNFGSVLDTNPLMATGARVQLFADNLSAAADHYIQLVTHRIFGVLDIAKPQLKA